ncbi:N-acetylmuramoyl-L-alanine amidase [Acuticoccus sp. I52.16.1]|uniref:N-acetylmuramoyl-L-alanine amidase n=1 Tax=Acuticoccus sp. I52.16.1 TaxID=2928472 RepID=UPI001FD0E235|nr:N-acetylmuramoyl-L-alanine amidase [Acuticoccus sp. I52.16.1]UOM33076.1 N-acetylmuramoyl-L-alanine amidase [Acuticoccus sp. I52.16.1]
MKRQGPAFPPFRQTFAFARASRRARGAAVVLRAFARWGAALVVLAALTALAGPARATILADSIAVEEFPGATRFILTVSGEPHYRAFAVDGPPRLVIDFDEIAFAIDDTPAPAGLIAAFRFGNLTGEAGRIVFDLAEPALLAQHVYLPAIGGRPARLVFDIEPVGATRFGHAAITASALAKDAPQPTVAPAGGRVVVIDPGHGGIDPGASTPDGRYEKDLVLAFARRLEARLTTIPGLSVRLTRSDDEFLSLSRRIKLARAFGADLFISLHADAAPQDYVHGATVYTLSERPSDAQAGAIAARENLSDSVSGAIEPDHQEEVSGILADLLRRETKAFSHTFAERLIGALTATVEMNSNPHRSARFRVLMAHDIPSVLLELGYLTNAKDAGRLLDDDWQEEVAVSVAAAVADFFDLDPPIGSEWLARRAEATAAQ